MNYIECFKECCKKNMSADSMLKFVSSKIQLSSEFKEIIQHFWKNEASKVGLHWILGVNFPICFE